MFEWLSGINQHPVCDSMPVSEWQSILETELRSDLHCDTDITLGVRFAHLPRIVVPSDFANRMVPDRTPSLLTEAIVDCIFDFINGLLLPRTMMQCIFCIAGCANQLMLIKRTRGGKFRVRAIELMCLPQRAASTRRHQMRAHCRRSRQSLLESVVSSAFDVERPSAAMCILALLGEHRRVGVLDLVSLADACDAEANRVQAGIDLLAQPYFEIGTGLAALCHLYMSGALSIGTCNELIEDAASFSERVTHENVLAEVQNLSEIAHRYTKRVSNTALVASDYFNLLRDAAVYVFSVRGIGLQAATFAHMHFMAIDDSATVLNF